MRKIKEVLRLRFEAQLTIRQIAASLSLSVGVVSKYIQAANQAQMTWPLPEGIDDTTLASRLFEPVASVQTHASPDYHYLHQELKRKGVTLKLLWEEYQQTCNGVAYQYAQFCLHYRTYCNQLKLSMRQTHRAGEKLFVDYSGDTIAIIDQHSGEIRQAQLFVGVLGASSYTFAQASFTQKLPDWIASHVAMLDFFGVVPTLIVPDNLKSAVTKACYYEPELNQTYADMAQHYGLAIIPARPYKPKDKAKVEAGVLLVQRWITARLRHQRFFSLAQLNQQILQLLTQLNDKPFQKNQAHSRRTLFETLDRPAMQPLPAQPYEFVQWKKAKVNIDYHIEVEHHYYSVPFQLAKQQVEVRIGASVIEILYKGQRIASHARSWRASGHSTLTEHMPKSHQKHLEWTPKRLLHWGQRMGPATATIIQRLLEDKPHPEMGYRSCLGVLSLAKRYGESRLEAACARALSIGSPKRKSIQSILETGLDQHPDLLTESASPTTPHQNVRGADYYH